MDKCNHGNIILTEEGYECLICGKVLGHLSRVNCEHPAYTGPSSAMMEDGDYRKVCRICFKRF